MCLPDWFSDGLICRLEAVPIKSFKWVVRRTPFVADASFRRPDDGGKGCFLIFWPLSACRFVPFVPSASLKQFVGVEQQGNRAVVAQRNLHMGLKAAGFHRQAVSAQ